MPRTTLYSLVLLLACAATSSAQNVRRIRWMAMDTPCGSSGQVLTTQVVGPTSPEMVVEVVTGNDKVITLGPDALERVIAAEAATGAIGAAGLTVKLESYAADGTLLYAGSALIGPEQQGASFSNPKGPGFTVGVVSVRRTYDPAVFGLEIVLRGEGANAVAKAVVTTTNPQKDATVIVTSSTVDAPRTQRRYSAAVRFDGDAAGYDYRLDVKLVAPRPGKKPDVLTRTRVVLAVSSVPQGLPCGGGLALQGMPASSDNEAPACCDHIDLDLDVDP